MRARNDWLRCNQQRQQKMSIDLVDIYEMKREMREREREMLKLRNSKGETVLLILATKLRRQQLRSEERLSPWLTGQKVSFSSTPQASPFEWSKYRELPARYGLVGLVGLGRW